MNQEQIDSFWRRVRKGSDHECWTWIERAPDFRVAFNGQRCHIPRLAYVLTHGSLPNSVRLGHSCRNPRCCNPHHLIPRAPTIPPTTEDVFWAKVDRGEEDACWLWTKSRRAAGYGVTKVKGKQWMTHRLAWTYTNGPIPEGLMILHQCDNPPCCNPSHLRLGTSKDNHRDAMAKDRDAKGSRHGWALHPELVPRGSQIGTSRLQEKDVREIRRLYQPYICGTQRLARQYGVSKQTIQSIVRRETWRHIE